MNHTIFFLGGCRVANGGRKGKERGQEAKKDSTANESSKSKVGSLHLSAFKLSGGGLECNNEKTGMSCGVRGKPEWIQNDLDTVH
jgi:hypothetical protein